MKIINTYLITPKGSISWKKYELLVLIVDGVDGSMPAMFGRNGAYLVITV
jgi:hypothetical protein